MIPLKDKVNVNAPVGTYPFGASPFGTLRNNPGDNSGTPVDVDLVQDLMIFAEALMAAGGITPNGVLDVNAVPQLLQAFVAYVRLINASETEKGTAEIATQAETNAGTDDERIVTPLKLTAWAAALSWTLRSNIADITYTVTGIGVTVNSSNIKYRVFGKTMEIIWYAEITNTVNAPTAFFILIPESKTANVGFDFYSESVMLDAGSKAECLTKVETANNTKIKVFPADGVTLTNGVTTISGTLTFQIA